MGFLFAFITAVLLSFRSLLEKRTLKNVDEYVMVFGLRCFAGLFLFLVILFFDVETTLKQDNFWFILLAGAVTCSISSILAIKGIKYGDLSLVGPVMTLTPLFILLTSPIMIGQFPSLIGLLGVLLIVFGSYTLNINELKNGFREPVKALFKNRGARYMLGAAVVWSIGSNIDKMGIDASSPYIWAGTLNALSGILFLPLVMLKGQSKKKIGDFRGNILSIFIIGFVASMSSLIQLLAVNLILVVYVISLKRLSSVFQVLIGHFIFKEEYFKERFVGVIIMFLGAILIVFS